MRFKKCSSLKRKLDSLKKNYGDITIDHGVSFYAFARYEFSEDYIGDTIDIYVIDFWTNKEVLYMRISDYDLSDNEIYAIWDKEFPKIVEIREKDN